VGRPGAAAKRGICAAFYHSISRAETGSVVFGNRSYASDNEYLVAYERTLRAGSVCDKQYLVEAVWYAGPNRSAGHSRTAQKMKGGADA